jgi:hypothetical protein
MSKQKNLIKIILSAGLTVTLSVLIIAFAVKAGSLNPSGTPAATGFTLTDIYNRLNTNAPAVAGNHTFTAPTDTSTPTMYSLTQVYNKIPTINPANLLATTTYLGVTGNIAVRGAFSLKASTTDQAVAAGYYSGGTLSGAATLVPGNVKSGVNIFGTIGSYAGAGGYTFGDNVQSTVLTTATGAGTYNVSNLANNVIKQGTTWGVSLGSTGTLTPSPTGNTATTSDVCVSKTFFGNKQTDWTNRTGTLVIDPATVLSGTTYCGIAGSASGSGFTYGSSSPAGVLTSPATPATGGTFVASNLSNSLIATGTVWGVGQVGTLLGHLFNGTGQTIAGGSQNNGGVEDLNDGGAAPTDRYSRVWTLCISGTYDATTNPGGNYCNTGDSGAAYMDNSTRLIWSKSMNASYGLDNTGSTMTWYIANNCTEQSGAGYTCTKKTSGKTGCEANTGWFVPHQKQLMQAYIDGSYGFVSSNSGSSGFFWSATSVANVPTNAWLVTLGSGIVSYSSKSGDPYSVRCVHPAN